MSGNRLAAIAERHILPSPGEVTTVTENADMARIIAAIMDADELSKPFTAQFARYLQGRDDDETLHNIWNFVKKEIKYVRDRPGNEVVKSPGQLWETKTGDCKSFSIFIGSILNNLGYDYKYRVAIYSPLTPQQGHIYPVAILPNGVEVVVDAVHTKYNDEAKYYKAWDYIPGKTGRKAVVSGLSGIGSTATNPLLVALALIATYFWIK